MTMVLAICLRNFTPSPPDVAGLMAPFPYAWRVQFFKCKLWCPEARHGSGHDFKFYRKAVKEIELLVPARIGCLSSCRQFLRWLWLACRGHSAVNNQPCDSLAMKRCVAQHGF